MFKGSKTVQHSPVICISCARKPLQYKPFHVSPRGINDFESGAVKSEHLKESLDTFLYTPLVKSGLKQSKRVSFNKIDVQTSPFVSKGFLVIPRGV